MAISKVTLNGETLMDVTGNTSGTDNMLYGTKGTAANGTSVTGTIVATPVDDTLSTSSHNAIENAAVATALAGKADSSAIPNSTSDLTNDSNFVSDSSYVHTDNNFTTTLKNKLDGIATGATVDDHKWNDVTLTKSTGTTSNNIYVPYMTSTSGTGANLATASTTPTAHYIAKYDANKRLSSTTPTAGDDSTLVATTAFVQSAISSLGSVLNYKGTKGTISNLPATGNTTGDVWIVTADSSEHVWNGSSWEQLGTTVDLSGYALASSIPDSTSDLTNDSGFLTSSDLPSWSQASTKPNYTATEVGAASSTHTHGNITNDGDITGNVAIASGDRLVINDESTSKINNSSITFGSSTTTFLANNGTWQTPSGAVTSVNGNTGAVTVNETDEKLKTTLLNAETVQYLVLSGTSTTAETKLYSDTLKFQKGPSSALLTIGKQNSNNATLQMWQGNYITYLSPSQSTTNNHSVYLPPSEGTIALLSNIPTASTTTPSMDGTASYGSGTDYARANHVHPSDTTKMTKGADYVTAGQKSGTTLGNRSTAEGQNTTSSGVESHAEGRTTTASGNFSHSEGAETTASGYAGHAEGNLTIASGSHSHAEGFGTEANHANQHVFGSYNILDPSTANSGFNGNYVEIVGNGTSAARSNARTLDWSGNEVLAGKLTVGANPTNNMDVTTKQYVTTYVSAATVRPNLLRNWYFLGSGTANEFPINFEKQASYNGSSNGYGVTAWVLRNGVTASFTSTGLNLSFPSGDTNLKGMNQRFTNLSEFLGKTVTISILVTGFSGFDTSSNYPRVGLYFANSPTAHSSSVLAEQITGTGLFTTTGTIPTTTTYTGLNFSACYVNTYSGSIKIAAVKFEIGDTQTLAHQEGGEWVLNELPDYDEEINRCLTYKGMPSGGRIGGNMVVGKIAASGNPYLRFQTEDGNVYQWVIYASSGNLGVEYYDVSTGSWSTIKQYAPIS